MSIITRGKQTGIYLRPIAELDAEVAYMKLYIERLNEIRKLRVDLLDGEKTTDAILGNIANIVCAKWKIEREELFKGRGKQNISDARFAIFYVALVHTQLSQSEIGRYFKMDHTSVTYGRGRAEEMKEVDKVFATDLKAVETVFLEQLEKNGGHNE
jgi:chromosomal replication initiation ATPase DnaA